MSLNVFFYSKYCQESMTILNKMDLSEVHAFCVDNANIRTRMLKNNNWGVEQVPSLLQISEDGRTFVLLNNTELLEYVNSIMNKGEKVTHRDSIIREEEEEEEEYNKEDGVELELNDSESEVEIDDKEKDTSQPSKISNIVQQMQREREQDENLMKKAIQ